MTVMVAEDCSMCVQPSQVVRTAWADIDVCKLGWRVPMSPEAVENASCGVEALADSKTNFDQTSAFAKR